MARETLSSYEPRQKTNPIPRPETVRSLSGVVRMSNIATQKLPGDGLSTLSHTGFPFSEKGAPTASRQLGNSFGMDSTGQVHRGADGDS